MEPAFIYIDEFGNAALNVEKQGTFSHFVYTSFIIGATNVGKAEEIRKEIATKFKLGPNIKSSNISEKQFDKRLQILKFLIENLNFTIDVLVIDKGKIESKGLINKRVFYKYFQSLYVTKYNKRYKSFYIRADEVGEEFRKELNEFVNKNGIQRNLFEPERFFQLANDKDEKLIQFADLLAGSLGKVFCTSHSNERAKETLDIVKSRTSIEYFPYPPIPTVNAEASRFDSEILNMNYEALRQYRYEQKPGVHPSVVRFLDYLSFQGEINKNRFVSTKELLTYLQVFYPDFTTLKLRTLVRDLRYQGLFIVSQSGKSGYKFASGYQDISEHFKHFMKYILPMLQKVKILNEKISQSSYNEINLLEKDVTLKQMKDLVTSII